MNLYRVQEHQPFTYQYNGDYKWHLPSMRCGTCHRPHASRLGCPNLDIAGKLDETPYQSGGPVSRLEFEKLIKPLEEFRTPDMPPLLPGMGFGPFLGRVMHGEKRDFLWIFGKKITIREEAFQSLTKRCFSIEFGPAIISDSKTGETRSDYKRILVTKPIKCVNNETLDFTEWKQCPECGLCVIKKPSRLFVTKTAIPDGMPLFAVDNAASIVCTEELAAAAKSLKLTNIEFEPVEVV